MGVFRLILALAVLIRHLEKGRLLGLTILQGYLAVQCFFIISGFYMALVLNEKYTGRGSYIIFLQQRFLRLFPSYWIIFLVCLLLNGLLTLITHQPFGTLDGWLTHGGLLGPLKAAIYAVPNLLILGQDYLLLLFLNVSDGSLTFPGHAAPGQLMGNAFLIIPPSWTLAVELTFYLMAPFVVRRSLRTQVALFAAGLALHVALYFVMSQDQVAWTYFFTPASLFFFMGGSIGYQFYRRHGTWMQGFAVSHYWVFILFGLFCLAYGRLPGNGYLDPFLLAMALVMVPLLFAATRKNRLDRLIGELSYPFYLIHWEVLVLLKPLLLRQAPGLYGPACALFTLLAAYLFYRFVETRTERFREHLFQKQRAALTSTA